MNVLDRVNGDNPSSVKKKQYNPKPGRLIPQNRNNRGKNIKKGNVRNKNNPNRSLKHGSGLTDNGHQGKNSPGRDGQDRSNRNRESQGKNGQGKKNQGRNKQGRSAPDMNKPKGKKKTNAPGSMTAPKPPISPRTPEVNRPNVNVTIRHGQRKPKKVRSGAGGLSVKNNGNDLVTSKPSPYHIYHPATWATTRATTLERLLLYAKDTSDLRRGNFRFLLLFNNLHTAQDGLLVHG